MGKQIKRRQRERKGFVLDASVALAWCFRDEQDTYSLRVAGALLSCEATVPVLWRIEVMSCLLTGERKGRSEQADTANWTWYLENLPIRTDDRSDPWTFDSILPIARKYGLTAYDAAYLELAIRRGLPLATLDKKLRAAAKEAGVEIFAA
ncbi:PIN domain-containing protein [Candidatus Peribacteria bacterium]|nr:PIN domain-containing protein [Candidatus Peribacteria bacterium]